MMSEHEPKNIVDYAVPFVITGMYKLGKKRSDLPEVIGIAVKKWALLSP